MAAIAPPDSPEAVCLDPPIFDHVLPTSVTPLNFIGLQHGYAAYIGQSERREISRQGQQGLLLDPEIRGSPTMTAIVLHLHDDADPWSAVFDAIGANAAEASPHLEYVLASLGFAAGYAPCDATMIPQGKYILGPEARGREDAESQLPCDWVLLTTAQAEAVRVDALNRTSAERQRRLQRRASITETKTRLGAELRAMLAGASPVQDDDDDRTPQLPPPPPGTHDMTPPFPPL